MHTGVTVYWRHIGSSLESSERRLDNIRSGEQDAVRGLQYFPCSPVACEALVWPCEQWRIYLETSNAYASGPLATTGPFQGPERGPRNAPESYRTYIRQKLDSCFPKFDNSPKNVPDVTNNELWKWKNLL